MADGGGRVTMEVCTTSLFISPVAGEVGGASYVCFGGGLTCPTQTSVDHAFLTVHKMHAHKHARTATSPLPLGVKDDGEGGQVGVVMQPVEIIWKEVGPDEYPTLICVDSK